MLKGKIKKYYGSKQLSTSQKQRLLNDLTAAYGDGGRASNIAPLINTSPSTQSSEPEHGEVYVRGTWLRTVVSLAAVFAIVVAFGIFIAGRSDGGIATQPGAAPTEQEELNSSSSKDDNSYFSVDRQPYDETLFMYTALPTVKLAIDGYDRTGANNNEILIDSFYTKYTARAKITFPADYRSIAMYYLSNGFYSQTPLWEAPEQEGYMDEYGYVEFSGLFIEHLAANSGLNDTVLMIVENSDGTYSITTDTLYLASNRELYTMEFLQSFDDEEAYQANLAAMTEEYGVNAQEYLQMEYENILFWNSLSKALDRYQEEAGYYTAVNTEVKEVMLDLGRQDDDLVLSFYAPACDAGDGNEYIFEDCYNIYVFADGEPVKMIDADSFAQIAVEEGLEDDESHMIMYNNLPSLVANCEGGTKKMSVNIPIDSSAHTYTAIAIPINSYCGAQSVDISFNIAG